MVRARRAPSAIDACWRLLAPVLAVTLTFSAQALAPAPVEADGAGGAPSIRLRQVKAEADMRRADAQIKKLQRLRKDHRKSLKRARQQLESAIKLRKKVARRTRATEMRLDVLAITLARKTQVRPDPTGRQTVNDRTLRKQVRVKNARVKSLKAKLRTAARKVEKTRALKRSRQSKPTNARIAKRVAERERAEARLSSAIGAMLVLAKQRAAGPAMSKRFRKPASGTISQSYGCTGYRANPARGTCRHFHDGVDIAGPKGTAVRASADGYVAYVGFSPWDTGSRAYVVIIGHSGGYETVYAHLKPGAAVRAGQRVERGDLIGRIGMTGTTSGPHVHWEVKRRGATVDPLRGR